MKVKPITLILLAALAAALFAVGVRVYWLRQDALAGKELRLAQQADLAVARVGLARSTLATPRGWLTSLAKVSYAGYGEWQVEYLEPRLANLRMGRQAGFLWMTHQPSAASNFGGSAARISWNNSGGQAQPSAVFDSYKTGYLGQEKIAGRDAKIIGLSDKATGRLLRVFWIDRETHIILRQARLDEAGRLVASTEYLSVTFLPKRNRIAPTANTGQIQSCMTGEQMGLAELARKTNFKIALPANLPEGYKLKESFLLHCAHGCSAAAQLRYSDGVHGFSVFEINQQNKQCASGTCFPMPEEQGTRSPTSILKMATARREAMTVVVVGDLAPEYLKQVAEACAQSSLNNH
jgi:hypothetical protein